MDLLGQDFGFRPINFRIFSIDHFRDLHFIYSYKDPWNQLWNYLKNLNAYFLQLAQILEELFIRLLNLIDQSRHLDYLIHQVLLILLKFDKVSLLLTRMIYFFPLLSSCIILQKFRLLKPSLQCLEQVV